MDKPKCVVIGTGSIGWRHLNVLNNSGKVDIFAFPKRRERMHELVNSGYKVVENWEQVQEIGIQHAIVATDTLQHPQDIMAAFQAGCDVLSEKPLAVNTKDALILLRSARTMGRGLYVGTCLRFQEALNTFRELLNQVGHVHGVRIECRSYLPEWRPQRPYRDSYSARPNEGGVLRDLIHEIDYATWIFGWPKSVMAKVRSTQRLDIMAEDTADIIWETEDGNMVSISLDYLSRPPRRSLVVFGEYGTLEWDGLLREVKLSLAGKDAAVYTSMQLPDKMYQDQDLDFLLFGSTPSLTKLARGEEGVRTLAICDAARASSEEHVEIAVDYSMEQ